MSVDLSGSTAFKNSKAGVAREEGPTPKWVTVFQQFYANFPAQFKSKYQLHATEASGVDSCPSLWKAVGDELVFCGKVTNKKAVMVALVAFTETLYEYRKLLQSVDAELDLKGAGWLAAFPEPNRAVQLSPEKERVDFISASEALEAAADGRPFEYDFLGKAIDTGFRVAASATPERFVLSVQLARLLVDVPDGAGTGHDIRFDRPMPLKGVNDGEAYPFLYIDTMDHLAVKKIRTIERELLAQDKVPSREKLAQYLNSYCDTVGTDEIMLPLTAQAEAPGEPESYSKNRTQIAEHLRMESGREVSGTEVDDVQPEDGFEDLVVDDGLDPLERPNN